MFTLSDLAWFEPQIQRAISLAGLKFRVLQRDQPGMLPDTDGVGDSGTCVEALLTTHCLVKRQINKQSTVVKPVIWGDREKVKTKLGDL